MDNYKLCYVYGSFAYFTTQELSKQWGDDWNDAPYEHNAGSPYDEKGQNIKKIAFDGDLEPPCEGYVNSKYSVEDINAKAVPWLYTHYSKPKVSIFAGASIEEFKELVIKSGGNIYIPVNI